MSNSLSAFQLFAKEVTELHTGLTLHQRWQRLSRLNIWL